MAGYNVEIRTVGPVLVASRRESIPDFGTIGSSMNRMYNEVVSYIRGTEREYRRAGNHDLARFPGRGGGAAG